MSRRKPGLHKELSAVFEGANLPEEARNTGITHITAEQKASRLRLAPAVLARSTLVEVSEAGYWRRHVLPVWNRLRRMFAAA